MESCYVTVIRTDGTVEHDWQATIMPGTKYAFLSKELPGDRLVSKRIPIQEFELWQKVDWNKELQE